MTDEFEPRGVFVPTGTYQRLNQEPAADLADSDVPDSADLDDEEDDEDDGSVPGSEGLPDDVRDGDIGASEPEE